MVYLKRLGVFKMKKYLTAIILSFIIFPISVFATSISSAEVTGPKSITTGTTESFSIDVKFDDLDKTSNKTYGITNIVTAFEVDDDSLIIESLNSNFDSKISKSGNTYIITSTIKEGLPNTCQDRVLYCGDYKIDVRFMIKKTSKKNLTIKLKSAGISTYESNQVTNETLIEAKSETFLKDFDSDVKVSIKKSDNDIIEAQDITQMEEIDDISSYLKSLSISTLNNIVGHKSNNNHIASLTIAGYDIPFNRDTNLYRLEIFPGTNALNIAIELEDAKATYVIEGADDLSLSGNETKITVTAEDGSKRVYIITTYTKNVDSLEESTETVEILDFEIDKKHIQIAIVVIILILCLCILKIILSLTFDKIKNRKINRALKELNREEKIGKIEEKSDVKDKKGPIKEKRKKNEK